MSRERSTNRTAALKLWLKSGRILKLTEIADQLGVSDTLILIFVSISALSAGCLNKI